MAPTEFENHQVFEKIDQISSRIEEKELRKLIGVDGINFFETAISYLKDRLKLTIPTIVQEAELTTISKEIENLMNDLDDKKEEDVSLSSIERIMKMLLPVIKK